MSRIEQNVKLLDDSEPESDYQASAYNYDTSSEVESVHSLDSSSQISKTKKTFRPSTKKKIQLTFQNLTVKTIPKRKKFLVCEYGEPTASKTILENILKLLFKLYTFVPGQFTAILGSSGAGKTTFLNFLSGRLVGLGTSLRMSGKILINGKDRDKMPGSEALSCYVQQDDILFMTMTVRECLIFAAKLKLKGTTEEKLDRVDEVIKDLRLTKCQNTKIGGSLFKGISGGERKRTNIGVELITDPQLIFLDEPTTGLDSFTATSVMETLRALAESGRTVVSTIHQPNSEIFDNFDRLMLIAQGKILYYNEAHKACDYFDNIGYKCPEMSNPADYFMSIMSAENPNEIESDDPNAPMKTEAEVLKEYSKKITYLSDQYQQSALRNDYAFVSPQVVEIHSTEISGTMASWWYQLYLLTMRSWQNIIRLPDGTLVKFIATTMTGLFIVVLFQEMKGTLEGVQNRNGCLFFICTAIAFNSIQGVILLFPEERPVFLREVNNKMYSVSAYFFGKLIAEIPSTIWAPVLHASTVYFFVGLSMAHPWTFPIHCVIQILLYLAGAAYTLIVSVAFSEKKLAVTLIPVLLAPFQLLSGFFVNDSRVPIWLKPFNYISFYRYGFQALMINEYTDLELECMEIPKDRMGHCDPLGDFKSPQNLYTFQNIVNEIEYDLGVNLSSNSSDSCVHGNITGDNEGAFKQSSLSDTHRQ